MSIQKMGSGVKQMEKHYRKIYIIGLAVAVVLVAILISRIPQIEGAPSTTDTLEDRVAYLEERLDVHLEELRVHEDHILALEDRAIRLEDAMALHLEVTRRHEEQILALEALQGRDSAMVTQVVGEKLWERATSCRDDDCYYGDPILNAFYHIPPEERHQYVVDLASQGTWFAQQINEADWLVTAQLGGDQPFDFLADSTYHTICWTELEWCKEE
jgi:predicted RNase H-like HicB family nuclease